MPIAGRSTGARPLSAPLSSRISCGVYGADLARLAVRIGLALRLRNTAGLRRGYGGGTVSGLFAATLRPVKHG